MRGKIVLLALITSVAICSQGFAALLDGGCSACAPACEKACAPACEPACGTSCCETCCRPCDLFAGLNGLFA